MMIDFGETEIFEGQVAKAIDGIVGQDFALAHLLEEFADGFGVQEALSGRSSMTAKSRLASPTPDSSSITG